MSQPSLSRQLDYVSAAKDVLDLLSQKHLTPLEARCVVSLVSNALEYWKRSDGTVNFDAADLPKPVKKLKKTITSSGTYRGRP